MVKKINTVDELSIEHKEPWENSDNPKELFFNLDNISFSHLKCNISFSAQSKAYPVIIIDNESKTIPQLSKKYGISSTVLWKRYYSGDRGKNLIRKIGTDKSSKRCSERGVYWENQSNKWVVRPTIDGKKVSIGRKDKVEDAIKLKKQYFKQNNIQEKLIKGRILYKTCR